MNIATCQHARNLIAEIAKSVMRHKTTISHVVLPLGLYHQVLSRLMSGSRECVASDFLGFTFCKAYFSWSFFPRIKVVATNNLVFHVSVKPFDEDFIAKARQSWFSKLLYGTVEEVNP